MPDWHTQTIPNILHEFSTDLERGLTDDVALSQRVRYGENHIDSTPAPRLSLLFLKQIANIPVLLLAVTAAVLWYSQQAVHETMTILAILGFHVIWRFAQAAKARNWLQSIRKHSDIRITVIRGGRLTKITPIEVVPGDLLILEEGDYIPADARVVETDSLIVDESPLFNGAMSVWKTDDDAQEDSLVPPERQRNMVFGGTYVMEGNGRAIVVKTGKHLELQQFGRQAPTAPDPPTEAERQIRRYYNYFSLGGLIIAELVIAITWGLNRTAGVQTDWQELILLGLGFVIASVPDGIASTARAILADTAKRLLKKGVAIQRLDTLEELNNLTAVCIDEVGTFTNSKHSLSHVFVDEQLVDQATWEQWLSELDAASGELDESSLPVPPPESRVPFGFPLLILAASRCIGESQNQHGNLALEDVHAALKEVALRIGYDLDRYDEELPLVDEIPETLNHPYRGFVFKTDGEKYLEIILGTPEDVLQDCRTIQNQGYAHEIAPDESELFREVTEHLRHRGAHVFGVAYRISGAPDSGRETKRGATFLGLVALSTSAHEKAKEAVESCMGVGIKIVMITDKNFQMATELAKEIGLTQDRYAVADRTDLDESGEDYDSLIGSCLVYCKLSAAQTLKVVQHLGRQGHTLGFFGRRPRDMHAMKASDVGFASASHACHAVQHHAGCLTLKEGFPVIEDLLHHARDTYDNLRNSMRWLLSCTLAQLITLIVGFALHHLYGFPMPLTLLQIIWIHLLVNVVPLCYLGSDQMGERFRYRRVQTVPPFLNTLFRSDLLRGLFLGGCTIAGFLVTVGLSSENWAQTEAVARTTACTILIFMLLLSNFQCRRFAWESLPQRITANRPLLFTILVCMGLHAAIIYHEPAAKIFGTTPLSLREWQWTGMFCILAVLPLNLAKFKKRSTYTARNQK